MLESVLNRSIVTNMTPGTRVSCIYKRGYDAPGAARRGMHMEVQLFSGHDAKRGSKLCQHSSHVRYGSRLRPRAFQRGQVDSAEERT